MDYMHCDRHCGKHFMHYFISFSFIILEVGIIIILNLKKVRLREVEVICQGFTWLVSAGPEFLSS